jgi:acid phosphatase family membrane protein YuiD
MTEINPQEFGQLKAEVAGLRRDTDRQTKMLEDLVTDTKKMANEMAEARGGWKVVMFFGGGMGVLGASVATFFGQFFHWPK